MMIDNPCLRPACVSDVTMRGGNYGHHSTLGKAIDDLKPLYDAEMEEARVQEESMNHADETGRLSFSDQTQHEILQ